MPSCRLISPISGFRAGERTVITIPAGSLVERDSFLAAVGLTVVFWNGRRVTVTIQELAERSEMVEYDWA
jgi:hypothetical protein